MTAQPKNLLEYYMNEASARRSAEKIIKEQQATVDGRAAMKEVKIKDQTGRTITEWEGRASWLNDFAAEPKRVVAINTK